MNILLYVYISINSNFCNMNSIPRRIHNHQNYNNMIHSSIDCNNNKYIYYIHLIFTYVFKFSNNSPSNYNRIVYID